MMKPLLRALMNGLTFRGASTQDLVYGAWSAVCALLMLCLFFAHMKHQLFLSEARAGVLSAEQVWSAPLDDVFIHFDFARSTARGAPFEWSPGNGYSSGGTSLIYPWVLALGYFLGYQDSNLMVWAGVVAFVGCWSLLWFARHLVTGLPGYVRLFMPPMFLSVGALNWSLASGMEVAFFLGLWGLAFSAWVHAVSALKNIGQKTTRVQNVLLGGACALLVATRPEAAVLVACLVLTTVVVAWRAKRGPTACLSVLLWGAVPGASVVVFQHATNWYLTGSWSAAGALVKVELNDPFLTSTEKFDAWSSHLGYQILRVTDHHFSEWFVEYNNTSYSLGWLIWALALVPLFDQRTRRAAVLIWLSAVSWTLLVALNGQVRWQNERYTMPAVAWLLLNAGAGIAILVSLVPLKSALRAGPWGARLPHPKAAFCVLGAVAGLAAVSAFAFYQVPRFQYQLWFFGRASRNIHEQHIEVARRLTALTPRPRRVIVGDAGAIPFVSELPALDLVGLGGFRQLPFAKASRLGIGAALELIQRLPSRDLPDVMAIYPAWWAELPLWFGTELFQVPVRGNVVCGGLSKVVYRTDFSTLTESAGLYLPRRGERVVAELDFGDLLSEESGAFRFERTKGHVSMKMLPHPALSGREYWDAGRELADGASASFELTGFKEGTPAQLLWLLSPAQSARLSIHVNATELSPIELGAGDNWLVRTTELTEAQHLSRLRVDVSGAGVVLYHVWALQASSAP